MNFIGMIACFLVTIDCLERATGAAGQVIFSEKAVGAWFIGSAFWAAYSIVFGVRMFGRGAA